MTGAHFIVVMVTFPGGLGRARAILGERFGHGGFRPERLRALVARLRRAGRRVSLLAVDEAHCITEWGNEFRPVYRRLGEFRYLLGDPTTLALTGSATPATRRDILRVLRTPGAEVVVASFDRPNVPFTV